MRGGYRLAAAFGPLLERRLGRLVVLDQVLHLVHELGDVLELAVHRGEAHVGDLVELLQVLHHDLAQLEAA